MVIFKKASDAGEAVLFDAEDSFGLVVILWPGVCTCKEVLSFIEESLSVLAVEGVDVIRINVVFFVLA